MRSIEQEFAELWICTLTLDLSLPLLLLPTGRLAFESSVSRVVALRFYQRARAWACSLKGFIRRMSSFCVKSGSFLLARTCSSSRMVRCMIFLSQTAARLEPHSVLIPSNTSSTGYWQQWVISVADATMHWHCPLTRGENVHQAGLVNRFKSWGVWNVPGKLWVDYLPAWGSGAEMSVTDIRSRIRSYKFKLDLQPGSLTVQVAGEHRRPSKKNHP